MSISYGECICVIVSLTVVIEIKQQQKQKQKNICLVPNETDSELWSSSE